jgi:WD40 repeat protein
MKMRGQPLLGHSNDVNMVVFSPDGARVVSCSWDWQIRIWDVETRMMVCEPLKGYRGAVNCVAFSPDGTRLSGSQDGTILIWDEADDLGFGRAEESGVLDNKRSANNRSAVPNSSLTVFTYSIVILILIIFMWSYYRSGI